MDWPGGFFYRELAERYPEAKVLLSVREPESWEHSYRETIWNLSRGDSLLATSPTPVARSTPAGGATWNSSQRMLWSERSPFGAGDDPRADDAPDGGPQRRCAAGDRPRSGCSSGGSSEGWEPLCEFLGVPVPDEPLPHANDAETFRGAGDRRRARRSGCVARAAGGVEPGRGRKHSARAERVAAHAVATLRHVAEDLVVVATAVNEAEADLISARLAEAGLHAVAQRTIGGPEWGASGSRYVYVPRHEVERAKAVLEQS